MNNITFIESEEIAKAKFREERMPKVENTKDIKEILKAFSKFFEKNSESFNPYGITIKYIEYLIVSYKDEEGNIQTLSHFKNNIDPSISIDDLYNESIISEFSMNSINYWKNLIYSIQFSFYFAYANYKKCTDTLVKCFSEENYYSNRYNSVYSGRFTDKLVAPKLNLLVLNAGLKLKNFKNTGKTVQTEYEGNISKLVRHNELDEFFSDKIILMTHQKIMHDYFENRKGYGFKNTRYFPTHGSNICTKSGNILDLFESDPRSLEEYLENFDNDSSWWGGINSRDDHTLKKFLDDFDNNKERLIKIFNNYLYTKYAAGQKYSKLEKMISRMISMISVLKYDEYSVLDIVEDLPDKIQRAALKTMVGED